VILVDHGELQLEIGIESNIRVRSSTTLLDVEI
jgi:hypothetical protein